MQQRVHHLLSQLEVLWYHLRACFHVLNDVPTVGQLYRLNLSNYAGQVVKVGLYGESTVSNADNWFNVGKIRIETVETTNYYDTICEGYSFIDHGFTVPYTDLHVGMNVVSRYEMNDLEKSVIEDYRRIGRISQYPTVMDFIYFMKKDKEKTIDIIKRIIRDKYPSKEI